MSATQTSSDPPVENASKPERPPQQSVTGSWKFQVIIILFVLVYTMGGAWIFQMLEKPAEHRRFEIRQAILVNARISVLKAILNSDENDQDINNSTRWNVTLEALEAYESKISLVMESSPTIYQILISTLDRNVGWSNYLHAYFFVLTLISTIGYGNIAPKTEWGRVFCVCYAVVGIPTFLILIAQAGQFLAQFCITVVSKVCGKRVRGNYFASNNSRRRKLVGAFVSLSGVLVLVFMYMSFGAITININESWGFIDSFYFCFITLTTVGFGDILPSEGKENGTSYLVLFVRTVYTVFELAVTSTAIALVQKHYSEVWAETVTHVNEKEILSDFRASKKLIESSSL